MSCRRLFYRLGKCIDERMVIPTVCWSGLFILYVVICLVVQKSVYCQLNIKAYRA